MATASPFRLCQEDYQAHRWDGGGGMGAEGLELEILSALNAHLPPSYQH